MKQTINELVTELNDAAVHDETKTPHEITCDLHDAAYRVLHSADTQFMPDALDQLSKAVIAFQHVFIKGGKL